MRESGYSAAMATSPQGLSDVQQRTATLLQIVDNVTRELNPGNTTVPPATLDSALDRDLALDSLARVELAARVERTFQASLPESIALEAETPRDLLRALLKASGRSPLRASLEVAKNPADRAEAAPASAETLTDMLEWHVANHPDWPHIQLYDDFTDGAIVSYSALWTGACAAAAGLQARGLEPGERVALMLPTGSDYFFAFYGVLLAGAVPVPIYPPVRRAQLEDHLRRQRRILTNCQAAMLVTTRDATAVAHLLTSAVDSLRHVLTVAECMAASTSCELVRRQPGDLAFLQYTSGSTGDPKDVMLTHANLIANIRADGHALAADSSDVFVSWLPLYHDMGLIGAWLGSLYHAVCLVIMSPLTFLARPERWLWAIHRYRGTLSAAPNFAFELCLKRIDDADIEGLDLSHWRFAANGAEAISSTTLEKFCARFSAYGFQREAMSPVFGLAECAVGLAFTPPGRGPLIDVIERDALAGTQRAMPAAAGAPDTEVLRVVACGQPLRGHEIRVVDDAGRELPERMEGRLQFRGPSATSGYYRNPAETGRLFQHGWLESGDRAYIAQGELYVTGRSKDIIIRAGRNIYPAELEDAVGDLDGIRKGHVAVFGTLDTTSGTERVVVLAETRRRAAPAREALRTAVNALAADLIAGPPDEVVLAPPNSVLRTSSGKIRRAASRAVYEQGRIGDRESAVWVQVMRLALAAVVPQLRRARRAGKAWAYATYAWIVFSAFALTAWIVAWLPLPRAWTWRLVRTIATACGVCTVARLTVEGLEHLPPAGEPCVIVANHQSYLDGMVLIAALPRPGRFQVKGELKDSHALHRPLAQLGALFVERFDAAESIASLGEAAAALSAGAAVAIFPEGTFKRMPGVLPFHLGAFRTAAEAGVPVIPIAIRGTRSILRAHSWFPRRGAIGVSIGRPIEPDATQKTWPATLALRDHARQHILQHCGEPDLAHESNVVDGA